MQNIYQLAHSPLKIQELKKKNIPNVFELGLGKNEEFQ